MMDRVKHILNRKPDFIHDGWSNACSVFDQSPAGKVNLDTFFEASFNWMHNLKSIEIGCRRYPQEDFIAIIHNPHDTYKYKQFVKFTNVKPYPSCVLDLIKKHCKGLFFMCEYEARVFQHFFDEVGIDVTCDFLYHPIQTHDVMFSFDSYVSNTNKMLIQSGMHMRKNSTPFIVADNLIGDDITVGITPWNDRNQHEFQQEIKINKLTFRDPESVHKFQLLDYNQYLKLYKNNIFLLDTWSVTACNLVLDCISTNAPVIINRCEANREYLGDEYPLFFDHVDQIANLVTDLSLLQSAHDYLKRMDKHKLSLQSFKNTFLTSKIYQNLS